MMLRDPSLKYRRQEGPKLTNRQWPDRRIDSPPVWCSTDLRDGNQALAAPLAPKAKHAFLDLLVRLGFREIEIGFPSASTPDYEFARSLADIPAPPGLWYQALTQARPGQIRKTAAALSGVPRAIVNLYTGTAPHFRETVLEKSCQELIALACIGAGAVLTETQKHPGTDWRFQYTVEMFEETEPGFALEICERVLEIWQPSPERPAILNLEATVEIASPNVYADRIEAFAAALSRRAGVIISAHPHNDRGTAVAAAELALLAGAGRVEGCLFGNGERAGNADLIVLAANLYAQGIHPGLDLSGLPALARQVEELTGLPLHPRHPHAGELSFTTFAGTHQDGVRKGLRRRRQAEEPLWRVPYLLLDPQDLGHSPEKLIRVTSQSGKAGPAFLIEESLGIALPKPMQTDFYEKVQSWAEATGGEIGLADLQSLFLQAYGFTAGGAFDLDRQPKRQAFGSGPSRNPTMAVKIHGDAFAVSGSPNAMLNHFLERIEESLGIAFDRLSVHESLAADGGQFRTIVAAPSSIGTYFGYGADNERVLAALKAFLAIANRCAAAKTSLAVAA
jgi:2-isopropylmalate synthase